MAWTEHFGKPVYRVRFSRTDEPGIDTVCLSAGSKDAAKAGARQMYKDRLKEIKSVTRERETRY